MTQEVHQPPTLGREFGVRSAGGHHVANCDSSNPGLRWSADGVSRVEAERTEDGADDLNLDGRNGGRARIKVQDSWRLEYESWCR